MDIHTLFLLLCIGLFAGIASGFVGIGGGMIIVPALIFGLGLNQHMAQGTSLAMMIPPIGILAVVSYYKAGQIQLEYAGILALTFVVGAWIGSKWALSINPSVARLIFGLLMLFVSGRLILQSWNNLNP
ncbi:MAG: permease [Crocinitomicaceae bacterium]|nr:permease [Crocinitomicaceae bacterium]HBP45458.1 permease [Flavobacteriales bacterium]|tara:strand:+ start:865 stop:1251 length:387 start_codon:yes stop_codon:yes gene_type:complete